MKTQKIDFNLTGIPHTLLYPLLGRAMESKEKNSILKDQRAIEVLESLDYNFEELLQRLEKFSSSINWASERALFFDNEIKQFLEINPHATIVNLGAGLETAFYRVDNGQLTWVDLDVPQVMSIRNQLLPAPKRVQHIAKSIFDYSWMETVKKLANPTFFFAGGVFVYFTPLEVKALLLEMAKNFPQTEVVFDSIDIKDFDTANELFKFFDRTDVKFLWGIDVKEVQTWSPHLKIVSHQPYIKHLENTDEKMKNFRTYMTKIQFV